MTMQTFKVFAPRLKAARSEDGRMTLHGVMSSTIKDLHGDVMSLSALDDMVSAAVGKTIFLNHEYKVPEDVGGTITGARLSMWPDGTGADVPIDIEVNKVNPRAVNAFESIENGTGLGISIGALVPDGGAKYDKKAGGFIIDHVQLLEASLVGIPANPRSWVEYAVKSLNGREFEDAEEATVDADDIELVDSEEPLVETVEPETSEVEADIEDAAKPKQHVHPHAHPHDHEHTHGWGNQESTHSHPHAHVHSHAHGDDHEHEDTMDDSEHDHFHRGQSDDSDHAHENSVYNGIDEMPEDPSHPDLLKEVEPDATQEDASPVEPTSQDAPVSIPEDEGGESPTTENLSADEALAGLAGLVSASMASGNMLLEAVTSELMSLRNHVVEVERERDEAVALAQRALADTASILEKLSATPAGRRAVVREASNSFEHLSGIYSETFIQMLRSK